VSERPLFVIVKKLSCQASRKIESALLRGVLLVGVGVLCGALLGDMAAGKRLNADTADIPMSYTALSANPDAAANPLIEPDPCRACPDSYGVAARLRADREDRADDLFRALGAVEPNVDDAEAEENYQYGGSFPDLAPRSPASAIERPTSTPDGETDRDAERPARTDPPDSIAEAS
jgi:hypothetical protein